MNLTNYTQIEQAREDVKAHPRGDAVRDQARVHLVQLANERGGCDNTTIIAVEVIP